jgi:hypothetical protein
MRTGFRSLEPSGAEWWVAGPVVERAEDADVDLDEVNQFYRGLGT